MALIVTLFSIPSYANDDKHSIACQAVGHFASGVSAYYFGRVAAGLDRAVAWYGSTVAGTQALVQAGFQNGASGACEVAKEVWKEATEENYERYGGGKRPGEISIGGGILGIEEECFLSTTCGDVTFTTLTNMSANQIGDLYYYNYQQVYMNNTTVTPPPSAMIK